MHRRRIEPQATWALVGAVMVLCLGFLIANGSAWAAEQGTQGPSEIVIGVSGSSKPFAYENDQGQLEGFNYELAGLLCKKLKRPCRVQIMPFSKVLRAVSEGTVSIAIANLLKTPEREKKMLFSQPVWRSTTSFIGASKLPSEEASQVKERFKICTVQESRQWVYVDALPGPKGHTVSVPRTTDLFDGLVNNKCDLAILPTVSALEFLTSARGRGFDYYSAPLTDPQLSGTVHIALSKQTPELVTEVDAVMEDLQNDGTYRSLIFRYFPFDIL